MYIEFSNIGISLVPVALLILIIFGWLRWRKTRNFPYILSSVIFGVYLIKALDVVFFPIPFYGEYATVIRRDVPLFARMNLIPFYFGDFGLSPDHLRSIIQNVFLTVPFGFGILFVTPWERKALTWLPWAVGLSLEGCQLLISIAIGYPYRVVDINDVLFNAAGVIIGYGILKLLMWLFLKIDGHPERQRNSLLEYLYDLAGRA